MKYETAVLKSLWIHLQLWRGKGNDNKREEGAMRGTGEDKYRVAEAGQVKLGRKMESHVAIISKCGEWGHDL